MLEKYKPVANLTTAKTNPVASAVNIRQAKSSRQSMALRPPTAAGLASGGDSVFEAMMAVNQSQNKIFDQVLDGPVSQQTQRQLAQLQAQSLKNSLVDQVKEGQEKPPAQSQAKLEAKKKDLALGQVTGQGAQGAQGAGQASVKSEAAKVKPRRTMGLMAGSTIVSGLDTGKIFSPSQLTAFRQKLGLAGAASATEKAAQSLVSGLAQPSSQSEEADEIVKFIRGAQEKTSGLEKGLSKSKILESGAEKESADETLPTELAKNAANSDVNEIIQRVSQALGLDPSLIKAVIQTESNFNRKAVSSAGAKGLMQLMPGTAKEMGVKDPFNPLDNIWGGARYLKRMLDSYGGNLNKALAAYNWGPGNVNRHGTASKNLPRETRRYIEVVNRNYKRFKKSTASA
ncbi:MAG: lytic transglycosylase domain-containing protein [Deltaproteobacteria bacterium]|jgi:soluble lytic murein transglycosylase-like protein|nr:lytic transglycosylase domain-containing protein [Deltaproteobacteria bacterium]